MCEQRNNLLPFLIQLNYILGIAHTLWTAWPRDVLSYSQVWSSIAMELRREEGTEWEIIKLAWSSNTRIIHVWLLKPYPTPLWRNGNSLAIKIEEIPPINFVIDSFYRTIEEVSKKELRKRKINKEIENNYFNIHLCMDMDVYVCMYMHDVSAYLKVQQFYLSMFSSSLLYHSLFSFFFHFFSYSIVCIFFIAIFILHSPYPAKPSQATIVCQPRSIVLV